MSMEDYDKPLRSRTMSVESSSSGATGHTEAARAVVLPTQHQ